MRFKIFLPRAFGDDRKSCRHAEKANCMQFFCLRSQYVRICVDTVFVDETIEVFVVLALKFA